MDKKQTYYVVQDHGGRCLMLGTYPDSKTTLLMQGDKATLFSNRRRAAAAIERSQRYAAANNLYWQCWRFVIVRAEVQ